MSLPVFLIYSRPGCHLCEVMAEQLLPLLRGRARLETRNIESNEGWLRRFGLRIPVLEIEGRIVCEGHLDPDAVVATLNAREAPPGSPGSRDV